MRREYCMEPSRLECEHQSSLDAALGEFDDTPKMGGEIFSQIYRTQLKSEIEERYRKLASRNKTMWEVNILL